MNQPDPTVFRFAVRAARLLALALVTTATMPCQEPDVGEPKRIVVDEASGVLELSLGEDGAMALADFIAWGQEVTGERITFDERDLPRESKAGNRVWFHGTLRFPRKQFAQEFSAFFRTMLYTRGFALVPQGDAEHRTFALVKLTADAGVKRAADEATETVRLRVGEHKKMPLLDFIEWAQQVSGKRFTLDVHAAKQANSPGSTVGFAGTFHIDRERFAQDFLVFFRTILHTKGLAVMSRGEGDDEVHEIVAIAPSQAH